jgi:hypothetical protein
VRCLPATNPFKHCQAVVRTLPVVSALTNETKDDCQLVFPVRFLGLEENL